MSQGDTKLQVLISDGQMEDRGDKVSLSTCALLQRIKHGKDLNRLYGSCLLWRFYLVKRNSLVQLKHMVMSITL